MENTVNNGLDVKFPYSSKVKLFEYILIKMVRWFLDNTHGYLPDFLESRGNNFGIKKVSLMPFFICTANEKRKELFDFFDDIIAVKYGLVNIDVFNMLVQNPNGLKVFRVDSPKISLKDDNQMIQFDEFGCIEKLELSGYEKEIAKMIDHSIKVLQARNNKFVEYDWDVIAAQSRRHYSWRKAEKFDGEFTDHETIKRWPYVSKLNLVEEQSVFAEKLEQRIYV